MAADAKRAKLEDVVAENEKFAENDARLSSFLEWLEKGNVKLSEKVEISKQGSCAQYGLVAKCDIDEGECVFEIPRSGILWQENNGIKDALVTKEMKELQNDSGWVPLLITLLHEYLDPTSAWRSYLDIVPDYSELDHPMFWERNEMLTELQGTGLVSSVEKDVEKMRLEYDDVVEPFLKKHPKHFSSEAVDFQLYKKLVAFVMAYSFTDPIPISLMVGKEGEESNDDDDDEASVQCFKSNPPMMVPLADILNHVAKNNAHLNFGKHSLEMCAVKPIKSGEEVFNTYGELSNAELLHMYGFAEPYPSNHYDVVEIPCASLMQIYEKMASDEGSALLNDKMEFLKSMELITDDGHFAIGQDGVLTEDELYHTLKVLFMDEKAFAAHKDKDGWSEDDSENEESESMANETLSKIPQAWKDLLKRVASAHLAAYGNATEEDEATFQDPEKLNKLSRRQRWSLYVRYGQRMILKSFVGHLH